MAERRWKQYRPGNRSEPDGSPASPPTHTPYKPPKQQKPVRSLDERTIRRTPGRPRFTAAAIAVAAAAVAAGFVFARSGGDDTARDAAMTDGPQGDTGFTALLAALEKERGSTIVRTAVIYPTYASVTAPYKQEDPSDERELIYHWDGELDEPSKSTGDEEAFDLATVDPAMLDGLCPQVEALVEDPEVCYLIIAKPAADDETPEWITGYASNEFSQSAHIDFGLDGTVLQVSPVS